ncbi:uncharacterized protein At5g41620-like isoform X2 [Nicotiana tomentosiformis]|uniref:uncharacterized protein At5g41620-like isoform X2 n=1 Tax=Nicotiana tomentosiformis TaxID=4098 RepID=UPI00051BB433|nr:uncharacterized protein LOC104102878 isoform X2 [Nicotiana tomentosiformis]
MNSLKSPSLQKDNSNYKFMQTKGSNKNKDLSVSARKLAATLREINGVAASKVNEDLEERNDVELVKKERILKSSKLGSVALQFSDPFHAPVSERMERSEVGSRRRRKLMKADFCLQNGCFMEVSKLIHEHKYNHSEVDILLKKFEEEKMAWKIKEQDNIHTAITSVARELKIEKKLRNQTERLNKKLGRELADTKASLSKAVKELEGEKKDREILEQVCEDLARGLGEDRAEVEELKRQSAKISEEVEMERKMLQLADVMREERVQMKLSDAKYQFEEKNAVVDKLRNELEAYLRSKKGHEQGGDSHNFETINELERRLRETLPITHHYQDKEKGDGEVLNKEENGDKDDSADSDLHSVELNMGDNGKSYQWCTALQNDPIFSISDKNKERRSISEKFPRQNISLERETSDGIEWEFSAGEKENVNTLDRGISNFHTNGGILDFSSQAWKKDCGDEIERYKMIKDLRDHIVSASRITSSQDFSSPTENWSQQRFSSGDPNKVMGKGFSVL